jgi:DNA (cytosine-5)-methyltransferase 1
MRKKIKIIDLFSGPGGLGEGFSSFKNKKGESPFQIISSIEKDESAHKTLFLRAFFRQFEGSAPKEYYDFLKGKLGKTPEQQLYSNQKFSAEFEAASNEAHNLELGKDNQEITARISHALGNDECVLIGGPPCQAYSLAGVARNKNNKSYNAANDPRNFLYKEYLKVIAQFQPAIFVMENVKGMLSAKVNGESIYEVIFNDLKDPCKSVSKNPIKGRARHCYRIYSLQLGVPEEEIRSSKDYLVYMEKYGIPQKRHRVILIGVRDDLTDKVEGLKLEPSESSVSVLDVLSDLPSCRSGLSKETNSDLNWINTIKSQSAETIKALRSNNQFFIASKVRDVVENLKPPINSQGRTFNLQRTGKLQKKELRDWYYDKGLGKFITNHETRGHLASDLQRYLFCSAWGQVSKEINSENRTPKSKDFPEHLFPNHKNFNTGKFADRFRVQVWDLPATTITCHISKDGHYYIHPDPSQCRSLTVREAARIQTFPDNYLFLGNRTQQYVQVGNAVPPLLANQIAAKVYNALSSTL